LFLVSKSWLKSEWAQWELYRFTRSRPDALRIVLLRMPATQCDLPVGLVNHAQIEWLEDATNSDALLWHLYCSVRSEEPGLPQAEWPERWRALQKTKGVSPAPVRSRPRRAAAATAPPALLRPSLPCNRAVQWQSISELRRSDSNDLLLVPGSVGRDHHHFLQRIQYLLDPDPPRSIVEVAWRRRPEGRDQYRAALAAALQVSPGDLSQTLAERLQYTNLVLLHPCLRWDYSDDQLVSYYLNWLPELISESQPANYLKCIQPVEWPDESLSARLRAWMRRSEHEEGRAPAEQFIGLLLKSSSPLLRAVRVTELGDVSRDDIDQFCQTRHLNQVQAGRLVERIDSRRPRTPKELFETIDVAFPEIEDMT
jgi:hypothetical protein